MNRLFIYLSCAATLYAMEPISKSASSSAIVSSQLVVEMNELLKRCPPFYQLTLDVYSPESLNHQGAVLIADRIIQHADSTHLQVDRDRMIRTIFKLNETYPQLAQFLQVWSENKLSSEQEYLEIISQLPRLALMASANRQQRSACCTIL